jgi:hypothetical protein
MSRGNGYADHVGDSDIAIERNLPCKLTEAELLARGDAMAAAELKIDTLKAERRGVNAQIREQTDERNKLAHTIESELEHRPVICKWIADFTHNVFRLVRQDTGDEIETRPMTAADRQGALPLDGSAPVAADGGGDVPLTELQASLAPVPGTVPLADDAPAWMKPKPKKTKPAPAKPAAAKAKGKGKAKSAARARA